MSGAAIGSFLNNFIGGAQARQQWDRNRQIMAWDKEDRGIEATERDRRHKREDANDSWLAESRQNTRGDWGEQDEVHARNMKRADADDKWTENRRGRTIILEGRDDAVYERSEAERQAIADAWAAANQPPVAIPAPRSAITPTAPVAPDPATLAAPERVAPTPGDVVPPVQPESRRGYEQQPPVPAGGRSVSSDQNYYVTGSEPGGWQFPKRPATYEEAALQADALGLEPRAAANTRKPTEGAAPVARTVRPSVQVENTAPTGALPAEPFFGAPQAAPEQRRAPNPEQTPARVSNPMPEGNPTAPAAPDAPPEAARTGPRGMGSGPSADAAPRQPVSPQKQATAAAAGAASAEAAAVDPAADVTASAIAKAGRNVDLRNAPPETIRKVGDRVSTDAYQRFMTEGAPKIIDAYMKNGNLEKATQFRDFIEAEGTKKAMGYWTKAQFAAAIGDDRGFSRYLAMAHNTNGYGDDRYEIVAKESGIVRDEDGNTVGAEITYRDRVTGKEFTRQIEGEQDFYALGIETLSPAARFEAFQTQVEAVRAARQAAVEAAQKAGADLRGKQLDTVMKIIAEAMQPGLDGSMPDPADVGAKAAAAVTTGAAVLAQVPVQPGAAAPRPVVSARP